MKLLNASVLCIGAGGLGCPISLYLAAAGVGTIGLADVDVVSPSNLQRQVLFGVKDIGEPKVEAAARRLKDLNPDLNLIEHRTIVNSENVLDLIEDYDIIIDGTDNFPTRYCVNDACVIAKKPNVYGSIFRFEGMVTVFAPHLKNPDTGDNGPCYRCMYPEPPDPGSVPSCAEGGVLGVICGTIGSLQANETVKLILGLGRPAIGRLLTYSSTDLEFRTYKLRRDPNCPVCGDHPTITKPVDYEQFCGVPIMDPKSLEETKQRSPRAKAGGHQTRRRPRSESRCKGIAAGLPVQAGLGGYAAGREDDAGSAATNSSSSIAAFPTNTRSPPSPARADPPSATRPANGGMTPHKDEKIVVHCKSGGRSMQFTQALRQAGFKDVKSMAGGYRCGTRILIRVGRSINNFADDTAASDIGRPNLL